MPRAANARAGFGDAGGEEGARGEEAAATPSGDVVVFSETDSTPSLRFAGVETRASCERARARDRDRASAGTSRKPADAPRGVSSRVFARAPVELATGTPRRGS